MSTTSAAASTSGARVNIQRFGAFLSGMIMPNIAAFIAWGLITALFIPTGWTPNENLAKLVGPTIVYLLPLLIANTGGRAVYGVRGGVIATIATMGVIVGTSIPMFMGAMIMGPLAAWVMKQVDQLWEGRIAPGFEMLVNNFSGGIVGGLLAIAGFFGFAPVVTAISNTLGDWVKFLTDGGLLPLLSIIVEPAKVLFLNNAINHGVFTPLGTQQAAADGKSLLFLVEANPGPGLGILLAYAILGVGMARASAPGAIIIHFLGGIHEIYFPYVLMKPMIILAAIAGGATGVATNAIFHSGLRAPASPGSIFAVLFQTDSNSYLGVILSVVLSATVSFLIAAVILRSSRARDLAAENAGDLSAAVAKTQANKGRSSAVLSNLAKASSVKTVVFACDAGMGSSAMGATVLRKKLKDAGVTGVTVSNVAIAALGSDADVVVTHRDLTDRAKKTAPGAVHYSVSNFMDADAYDGLVEQIAGK